LYIKIEELQKNIFPRLRPRKSYPIILARYYQNWEVKKRNSKARFPRKIITPKIIYKFTIMLTEHRESVYHLETLWVFVSLCKPD